MATAAPFALSSTPIECADCGGRGGDWLPVQWSDGPGSGFSPCPKCREGKNFEVAILPTGCEVPEGLETLSPSELESIRFHAMWGNDWRRHGDKHEKLLALGLLDVSPNGGPGYTSPCTKVSKKGLALLAEMPRFWARRDMSRHEWKVVDTADRGVAVCGSRRSAQMVLDALHATEGSEARVAA